MNSKGSHLEEKILDFGIMRKFQIIMIYKSINYMNDQILKYKLHKLIKKANALFMHVCC